jgi:hypothetical protein
LKARLFILRRLCQEAKPYVVALIEPLDRDTRPLRVIGTQATGIPLEGFHSVEVGEQRLQIQGESRVDHCAIVCPTNEFHRGCVVSANLLYGFGQFNL